MKLFDFLVDRDDIEIHKIRMRLSQVMFNLSLLTRTHRLQNNVVVNLSSEYFIPFNWRVKNINE